MKDEYIIINRTALEKKIEGLEKQKDEYSFNPNKTDDYYRYNSIIKVLKEILSQSTPLIPEIEKAFDARNKFEIKGNFPFEYTSYKYKNSENYISNLKLNI